MKKILVLVTVLSVFVHLNAQDNEMVIQASKKITKQATPKQIIDSLQKRFPNAQAVQYYQTSTDAAKNGWQVTEEDNLDGASVDYYTLSFKNKNIKYYGLYSANGELVMSKLDQSAATLPDAVKQSLKAKAGEDYKDWKLVSTSYHKTTHHQKNNVYYDVTATKGSEKKTIFLRPDGTIIKEK